MLDRVVLAAGGTGGHVFPALALYQHLTDRGSTVTLITDERGQRYAAGFDPADVRLLPSGGIVTGSPIKRVTNLGRLALGALRARPLIGELAPDAVIGMGGYATFGPLRAAQAAGIPTVLCEQNSVMGLANRVTARSADAIALTFADTEGAVGDCTVTGNPCRPAVIAVGDAPYPAIEPEGRLGVLILGGSQGARSISERIPAAIAGLEGRLRARLDVVHQARPEDRSAVEAAYAHAGVAAEIEEFVDVPDVLTRTHLVLGRSGASTVCDVAVAGRPAVYLPLLTHADLQQVKNASAVVSAGGALMHREDERTPDDLTATLGDLLPNTARLHDMAAAARRWSRPDAAEAILDLVRRRTS